MNESPVIPDTQPQQSVEQFLAAQIANQRASSRQILVRLLVSEGGFRNEEARCLVDAYCDHNRPNLARIRDDDASWKSDLMTLAGCLLMPLVVSLAGGLVWLAYRFVVTPRPPEAATDGPLGQVFPASPWTVGLAALLTGWLVHKIMTPKVREQWGVYRRITPGVAVGSVLALGATVAVGAALRWAFPFLDRSWLYLIPGNSGSALNIGLLPVQLRYVGPVFLVALTACIPWFARVEELEFREGTRGWRDAAKRSLRFGLAHSVWAGVPVYAGLALTVSGLWLTYQYKRGGVERSTVYHTTHNLIIVAVLAAVLAFGS
ncbi:MAG TPA: hypothetical protein VGM37_14355 [Armatimonadota bacterium]|jgi:hypothetical protein